MAQEDSTSIVAVSSTDVIFHEASQTEKTQTWALGAVSWAGPLSANQYIAKEASLAKTELTRQGGTKWWVLTHKTSGEIVASCETTLKAIMIADRHIGYREARAWAIASVYTPAKFRKQGMAALLLTEVKKWFDGEGDCETSMLYSDIGAVSSDTCRDRLL